MNSGCFQIVIIIFNLWQFAVCPFFFLYYTSSQYKTASQKKCRNVNSISMGMGAALSIFSHIQFLSILSLFSSLRFGVSPSHYAKAKLYRVNV